MDQTIRKLIERLGEAIHESVAESELIAGVVQEIRNHGFDVLLMLEATIGLNELASEETAGEQDEEDGEQKGAFTAQDVHFLKSLRIAVEGENGET
ncbi:MULTISPECIES: hypothetical protein [Acidobacterium]|uniref:Uncharacterized protein n=1 Tax=Acidobacterium capsulatum (strain ATCC 51196 / DSM 11244 / BCRC 80197 / JCM 7670 / NBRC 15755 / NCIMB 13165 / 161) TaxID=240015 RepID=C1F888_ACIC5|nr:MULTISPECIES: hypothetical protein [Acidobacterium]ACO33670.1 hypothetical protein ACP_1895 [Acidobacterium capsulatum ATCC 51196]HCT59772.1 hypothetical protein [Acidobacterium sp.]